MARDGYRECFVFVVGSTPQIVTETISALSQRKPPLYPDEINVVTTATDKTRLEEALIEKGILGQLCEDYGIRLLQLDASKILIVKDGLCRKEDLR